MCRHRTRGLFSRNEKRNWQSSRLGDLKGLVTTGMAAKQLDLSGTDSELLRQEFNQMAIRFPINRRCRDEQLKPVSYQFANLIPRRTRRDPQLQDKVGAYPAIVS